MRKITVVSQKYNGTLRDRGASYLYHADETTIITVTPPGMPYFHQRKGAWLTTDDGSVDLYFKNKWYNVWHICEQHSGINQVYANIAMPVTLIGEVLTWVDLDLDLRIHLDGSLEVLDEDEFMANSVRLAYPPLVVEQARAAVSELITCYQQGAFPFTHDAQVALYEQVQASFLTKPKCG